MLAFPLLSTFNVPRLKTKRSIYSPVYIYVVPNLHSIKSVTYLNKTVDISQYFLLIGSHACDFKWELGSVIYFYPFKKKQLAEDKVISYPGF